MGEIPTGDAAAYLERSLQSAPTRYQAEVTVHAPIDVVRERMWSRSGDLEALDAGACRLRTGADSFEWLALSIVLLGLDFTVAGPPELLEQLEGLARRCTAALAAGPAAG